MIAERMTSFLTQLSFPLELLAAAVVFALPLKRRRRFWLRVLGGGFLLLADAAGYFLGWWLFGQGTALEIAAQLGEDVRLVAVLWCGVQFGCTIAVLFLCAEISLREAAYCAACAYMMEHMAYCLRILLEATVTGEGTRTGTVMHLACHVLVYLAVYLLFTRQMVQDGHYVTTAVSSLVVTVVTLTVVLGMSVLASCYGFEVIHAVYALFCCVFMLYGQVRQQRQIHLQSELDTQQQLWLHHKAQYELSRETIDIINQKCHDLKHQVAALKRIPDGERRHQVIDSLQESVMIYDALMDTGNEILDTVLTEKSLLCQRKGIALSCIADGALLADMDAVDLYTLFGNALDNAIEANEQLPPEGRYIDLQVRERAGLIFIVAANPYAGTLELSGGLPESSKEHNGCHGFGLKSIRDIAGKYGGLLTLSGENQRFTLQAVIPVHR